DPAGEGHGARGAGGGPRGDGQPPLEAVLRAWPDGRERGKGAAAHDAKGEARVKLPDLPAGAYRFRYETSDDFGAKFETFKDFVVAGAKTPLRVAAVLLAESPSVPAGGVARLLALSGIQGQELSLEIFRGGVLAERRRLSGSDASLVEIPVSEADRGGFGVRLAAVADHQLLEATQTVFVPWDDKKLEVS